jgi:L-histidine N-alpha-methyltransferase
MLSATSVRLNGRKPSTFYHEVLNGLQAENKYLSSKYFYDETGDKLFQQIMACPEYYPTRCEMEILQHESQKMVHLFREYGDSFDLIELGPGDATKSWHLLKELQKEKVPFTYFPIDISANVIRGLNERLPVSLPGIRLNGLNGEYMEKMEELSTFSSGRKIVLFMGANIGNMTLPQATFFLRQLHDRMQPGDLLLIGFDLKKHPKTILDAYNDRQGITRAFNLNLLYRINRELGADFNPDQFEHSPVYDPGSGACKSYLISLSAQEVHIGNNVIVFQQNEAVHMEISQKFTLAETAQMASQSGFQPIRTFLDSKKWFADVLWQRKL